VPELPTWVSHLRAPRDGVRGRAHRGRSFLFALLLGATIHYAPNTLAQTILNGKLPGAVPQSPAEPPASAPSPGANVADRAIPLPQVADQAEELDHKLEEISRNLKTTQAQITPDQTIAVQAGQIKERAMQVDSFIEHLSDNLQLRDEVVYWRALSRQSAEERKLLSARASELQGQILFLDEEQARWKATQAQIQDTGGIEVVAARVQQELTAISTVHSLAEAQLNDVLILQNKLSTTSRQISDSVAKLNEAEERFRSRLLDQDSPPLWSSSSFHEPSQSIPVLLRKSGDQDFKTAGEFLRASGGSLLSIPVVYILSLLALFRLRRYLSNAPRPGVPAGATEILQRPPALALLAALLISAPQVRSAPLSITLVSYVLWLGLVFRLTPLLVEPKLRSFVYPLLAFNLLELLRVGIPLPYLASRALLTLVPLAALVTFAWLAQPTRLRRLRLSNRALGVFRAGLVFGLVLLAAGVAANVCGFVFLSHVLGVGTLLSALFALAYYCVARVLFLFLLIFLDSQLAGTFSSEIRANIELWGRRVLILGVGFIWWTRSDLYTFMFREWVTNAVSGMLAYSFGVGKVHFTVGGVLTVLLILVVGYGLAKGFSSLLRSILTARLPVQRGLPYAISKVTYYLLMVLVLGIAVTNAGVELNKFTVITGAIGVGIGFGLQNIVNNFASGLILLFERPIRLDDTVEVNGLLGKVKRIGARASTIATFQGAEVIVPNSNLISNQVVNWTLSSPWRRIEIPVGVAYGTDPEAVLNLLVAEAAAQPNVMTDPAPMAFFMGFGDSALNFELRFWSARQDIWFQLKSDVTIGISRALREAGIEIPFPQRDLHVRSVDVPIAEIGPLNPKARSAMSGKSGAQTDEAGTPPEEHSELPSSGPAVDSR
jgi:potassium efflux system protein